MVDELAKLLGDAPVVVREGKKIVEVTAKCVNKGRVIVRLLADKEYDVVLTAGDDATYESMFRLKMKNFLTVKVGQGDTSARFRVPRPAALRRLLEESVSRPSA